MIAAFPRRALPAAVAVAAALTVSAALAQTAAPNQNAPAAQGAAPVQAAPAQATPTTAAPTTAAPTTAAPTTPAAPKPPKPPKTQATRGAAAKPASPAAPGTTAPAAATPAAPGAAAAGQPAASGTPQQGNSATLGLSAGSGPIDVTSDDSLEMQQANKVYIARGNAIAKRADRTLFGDVLMAYYRDIPNSSDTEIWRIVADGNVKLTTPTQSVVGDHGIYDLDTKFVIVTGQHLQLTTPQDVVTARDSMEWYDDKQIGVARGNAVGVRADRQIRGDVLTAQVSTAPGEASRISRIDAAGHVIVSRADQVGTGDTGIYNLDTGIVTLTGHVTLTRGENTLRGDYGVLDLEKGTSRLLPRPANAEDRQRTRVQGYIVPKKKTDQDNGAKKPGDAAKPADTTKPVTAAPLPPAAPDATATAAQKAQPDAAKAR